MNTSTTSSSDRALELTENPSLPVAGPAAPGPASPDVSVPSTQPMPKRGRAIRILVLLGLVGAAAAGLLAWDRARARSAWDEANAALKRHDLVAAARHLDRYVGLRPHDPAGWFLAARTARRRGQFDEARRLLDRCQEAGGSAEAIALERDLAEIQQGHLGEIDARLRATIEPTHPDAAFILEALARGYLTVGRLADAREACELWRTVDSGHPYPWLWLGWIHERYAQLDSALEFYRHALELAPDDRDAHVGVGRMLVRKRQPIEAAREYEWVLQRTPDDTEARLGLAECRIEQGQAEASLPLVDAVLTADPALPAALYLRGKAAFVLGKPGEAEKWLRKMVAAAPGEPEALHLLIQTLRAQHKDREADQLGTRLEELRRDVLRLSELIRKIGPNLEDAATCHEAGITALRLGRTQEGLNLLNEALRRKGDHRATHAALAEYYHAIGPASLADYHERLAKRP